MRLKSLELQGYKTFASRTEFLFAERVTAIVGPNGSGKSNVADALRWVLGEQSYTLLRGKKTEDMIFAGSEQRPKAGMASATVTFDNSAGWLPIDFSEVAVARRAYRDGDNEYLLNGQKVRLKDVSELLSQSGLAERTYTIIGQGLVDAALALKAEERRRLFEEAAGIGLYRSRREEALRRLETTKRNLDRVQDILAELQPRLRSLERQARRAQEYEQIKNDLREILREWYGYHWHRSQKELSEAREQARQQELLLQAARLKQAELDQQLRQFRGGLQALREQLNTWHRASAALHQKRESISLKLAVAAERERSLAEQSTRAEEELLRLKEQMQLEDEHNVQASGEVVTLQDALEDARSQAATWQEALSGRRKDRETLDRALQSARQTLQNSSSQRDRLQSQKGARAAQVETYRNEVRSAEENRKTAETELKKLQQELAQAEKALVEANQDSARLEKDLQEKREGLGKLESERNARRDEKSALQAQHARLQAQLDVLEQAEQNFTGYASGARSLLQAGKSGKIHGLRGTFGSALVVPSEFEVAITAALGDFLDGVILTEDAAVDELLRFLETNQTRAALIPMKNLARVERAWVEGVEGCLGIAADLVTAEPSVEAAVLLMLGQVVLVQDRQAAQKALEAWMQQGGEAGLAVKFVTLKGEVFDGRGTILAGPVGKSGVLSRPRQRLELQEKISAITGQIEERSRGLDEMETSLTQARRQVEQNSARLRELREQEQKASRLQNQKQAAFENAERQLKWQDQQRQRLHAEIERGEADLQRLAGEIEQVNVEINKARENVREKSSRLSELPLDEISTQLNHWNLKFAVAERALLEGKNRLVERKTTRERLQRQETLLRARAGQAQQEVQALEREKSGLRSEEAQVSQEILALRQQIDPAELELNDEERRQQDLQAAEGEARQALSAADHNHAQARILLSRRQEALETLKSKIEDDFGLVAFEYGEDISGANPLPLAGMVEQLPRVKDLSPELEETLKRQRTQLHRMGAINPEAQVEYREVDERFRFMREQLDDLHRAEEDVRKVVLELDELMQREFNKTFQAVATEFRQIFTRLFGGGSARLVLTDPDDINITGIDIEARLPGRREQGLSLLSGGERSLTAVALVFALLRVSPTPFCVLDEVDAMLDEANVSRFRDLLAELSQTTQFVIITHNRNTVQVADVIYGITMGPDSSSQMISLRLDEVQKVVAG